MVRVANSAATRVGDRVNRVRWAIAGSAKEPNSSRSPPLQNDRPAPRNATTIESSLTAIDSASAKASRISRLNALCLDGRLRVMFSVSPSRWTKTTGSPDSDPGGGAAGADLRIRLAASHVRNSGPD